MTGYHIHNSFFVVPVDRGAPSQEPHHDEAAALARADRSPAIAFVAIAAALAAFGLFWVGLLGPAFGLAIAAVVVSGLAWRQARRRGRPGGVAAAALIVGLVTLVVVVVLGA